MIPFVPFFICGRHSLSIATRRVIACRFKSKLETLVRRQHHKTGRIAHFTFTNPSTSIKVTRP